MEDELCGDGRGRFAGDEKGKDQAKDKAEEGDFYVMIFVIHGVSLKIGFPSISTSKPNF